MMEAHPVAVPRANDILMVSLSRYYANPEHMKQLIPFIRSEAGVSLRLVDWFVTNYAKKHNIVIPQVVNGSPLNFNVYLSYRAQLKAYSKQQFDPFRRRDRVLFYYDGEKSVETTVGQLNFFRWILQNRIADYIMEHAADIENDMIAAQKKRISSDAVDSSAMDSSGSPTWSIAQSPFAAPRKRIDASNPCKFNMTRVIGDHVVRFE